MIKDPRETNKKQDPYPPTAKPLATLTKQSLAYVTVKGIESETSYLQRDWPLFTLKELSDNAFDYLNDYYPYPQWPKEARQIAIRVWFDRIPKDTSRMMLRLAVRNSNVENYQPVFEDIDDIFHFNFWCSTKRYQHRETCGSLGDGLKRILGMGYALWTSNDNLDLQYEYNQWPEPVVLRFDNQEYRVLIHVDDVNISTRKQGPFKINAPTFTEIQIALPVPFTVSGFYDVDYYPRSLKWYYKRYKMAKRQTHFSYIEDDVM